MAGQNNTLRFERLFPALSSLASLPPLQSFTARDGAGLHYRHYPAESDVALILVHGSSTHSAYLCKLALALSAANAASVYTPDLRGHGIAPARRGDIDYVDQLEDDLADLIAHIRATNGNKKIILAGHSSGGGLALRFAGGRHGYLAAGYMLLAPYLGHNAPTQRRNSGGWASPRLGRIVSIITANHFGITRFNGVPVLRFNLPKEYRTGTETLSYSFRLMMGFNPTDYRKELSAIKVPLLVMVGEDDEAFRGPAFEHTIKPLAPQAVVRVIEGESHLGLVANDQVAAAGIEWLRELRRPGN